MLHLIKSVRRALGEGVSRLQDGDPTDNLAAREVIQQMRVLGYIYEGYDFISRHTIVVTSHLSPHGADKDDLTDDEKAQVLSVIDGTEFFKTVKDNRFGDLPDIVVQVMADEIRNIRRAKGLRFEL